MKNLHLEIMKHKIKYIDGNITVLDISTKEWIKQNPEITERLKIYRKRCFRCKTPIVFDEAYVAEGLLGLRTSKRDPCDNAVFYITIPTNEETKEILGFLHGWVKETYNKVKDS